MSTPIPIPIPTPKIGSVIPDVISLSQRVIGQVHPFCREILSESNQIPLPWWERQGEGDQIDIIPSVMPDLVRHPDI